MRYLKYRRIVEKEIKKFEKMLKKNSEIDRTIVDFFIEIYYNQYE